MFIKDKLDRDFQLKISRKICGSDKQSDGSWKIKTNTKMDNKKTKQI